LSFSQFIPYAAQTILASAASGVNMRSMSV
jgi:hypothetical protein